MAAESNSAPGGGSPTDIGRRARDGETVDGLLRNRIAVIQAARGYRVSEDALILAWFVRPCAGERILDAGTGSGVIAFALAAFESSVEVVGLEIQEKLADRARRGARLNRLEDRVTVVHGDMREATALFRPGGFDVVVSNPPYHEHGRGRLCPDQEKALARHQLLMPPGDLIAASSIILRPGGRIVMIYPTWGRDRIESILKGSGFKRSRMLWIHPRENAAANLFCIEARLAGEQGMCHDERLILYDSSGKRTPEAERVFSGAFISSTSRCSG